MISDISADTQERLAASARGALHKFSNSVQMFAAAEELSELSVKLIQVGLGKERPNQREAVQEEIADCYIVLQQMAHLFLDGPRQLDEVLNHKLAKLERKLSK